MVEWNGVELAGLGFSSDRLMLRSWRPSDAAAVETIMADDRMHAYLKLPRPYTAEAARQFVAEYAPAGPTSGKYLTWAVVERTSGAVVGSVGLHRLDQHDRVEIGYWTATSAWGRGFATEAVRTLAEFVRTHGVERVQIVSDPRNIASVRVALAAGFRFEAILRREHHASDGLADSAYFSRLSSDSGDPVPPAWPAMAPLTDGTVLVRPMTAADWPTILSTENNPENERWALVAGEVSAERAQANATKAELDWLVGTQARTVICDAESGAGAGTLLLRRHGPPDVVGIGYGLAPDFRGRGFTTRALRLVADWAFTQTPIARLELGCKVGNEASARSALNAGFVEDGLFAGRLRNLDGTYADERRFGLTRPA